MLTVNLDIHDCLFNSQTGNINYTEFAQVMFRKNMKLFLMNKMTQNQ